MLLSDFHNSCCMKDNIKNLLNQLVSLFKTFFRKYVIEKEQTSFYIHTYEYESSITKCKVTHALNYIIYNSLALLKRG